MSASAKGKNKLFGPIVFLLFCAIGGAAGYWLGKSGLPMESNPVSPSIKLAVLIFLIPALFIVIAIHEAGHALVGSWVKFDFRLYVVGPFMWDKESGNWKFKWNKSINTAGGLVICLPKGPEDLSRRFLLYVAGGPIASVLLSIVAYAGSQVIEFINQSNSAGLQLIAYCFMMVGLFSLLIFLSTVIPMQFGGFASDGARIFRLLRGGDAARFETLIVKIIAATTSGTRPAQLDLEELEEADLLAKKIKAPFGVYILSYFHQAYFDRGDNEKAEYYLQQYISDIDSIPEGLRGMIWLDAAFFYAYGKRDLNTALIYWSKYTPSAMIPKAQVYATEAAIGFLRGKKETVIIKAESAIRELPLMMDKGAAIVLKERLNQLVTTLND